MATAHSPLLERVHQRAALALAQLRQHYPDAGYPEDVRELLYQRMQLMGLGPAGQVSANGCCHLMATADGQWLALNLARPDDWQALPALLNKDLVNITLPGLVEEIRQHKASVLLEQGRMLGLAIAQAQVPAPVDSCYRIVAQGQQAKGRRPSPRVLDLSSLWAGPLCSQLLRCSGASVTQVESLQRPDGLRLNQQSGAGAFYQALHRGKEHLTLDFHSPADLRRLGILIQEADIIIEGSRPRALCQLGFDAGQIVRQSAGKIWVSITGYGRDEPSCQWVAFGDDAAISAGLFDTVDGKPVFVGDAIADPLTGIHGAWLALQHWHAGSSALLDVSLHQVARYSAQEATSACC